MTNNSSGSQNKGSRYTQGPFDKDAYTRDFIDQKACMRIHALSCIEKHVQFGKLGFGPWYFDIGPWYLV